METNDILNKKVGDKDLPKSSVTPKEVVIVGAEVQSKKKDGATMKTPLLHFLVKHPDKEEPIRISKVQYLDGKTLVTRGIWIQTDEQGNFFKGSVVEKLLKKLGAGSIGETTNMRIDTVTEDDKSPYLALKLY